MRNIAALRSASTACSVAIATAGFACIVAATSARATVVVVPTLDEMSVASDLIAEVEVGDARVFEDGGRIVTLTDLVVKEPVKGAKKAGDVVVVYQLGGALNGRNQWISGAHKFVKGERLVVFAVHSLQTKYGASVVVPYGIGFGLFQVVPHQDGLTGAAVSEIVGDVVTADGKVPETRRYDSLAAFEETIRAAIAMKAAPDVPQRDKLAPKMKVTR